jgi:hypothetical protein
LYHLCFPNQDPLSATVLHLYILLIRSGFGGIGSPLPKVITSSKYIHIHRFGALSRGMHLHQAMETSALKDHLTMVLHSCGFTLKAAGAPI